MQRLSANLKASALKPKALTDAEERRRKDEGYETEEEDDNDEEPQAGPSSTSAEKGEPIILALRSPPLHFRAALTSPPHPFTFCDRPISLPIHFAFTLPAEGMDVEGESADKVKVSTAGPRLSHRESYKASKGFTVRQAPKTHFRARGEKKRMGCKPHRRR